LALSSAWSFRISESDFMRGQDALGRFPADGLVSGGGEFRGRERLVK
jgi:hypothetical protein